MPDLMKLGIRARKLSEEYSLGKQIEEDHEPGTVAPEPSGVFIGDLGYVEHLVHELAHALCLNVPFGPDMSKQIEQKLNLLGESVPFDENYDHATHQEAFCIGVEVLCCGYLEMPLVQADFSEMAAIQGATWEDVEMVQQFEWAKQMARVIANHLQDIPLTNEDLRPKHFPHLKAGEVVKSLVDYGPGSYDVSKGMIGVVYREADKNLGLGARVRWLECYGYELNDVYESDVFEEMYERIC